MSPAEKGTKRTKIQAAAVPAAVPAIPPKPKIEAVEREEAILQFWKKGRIFERSLESRKRGKPFIFYEGPPTANAAPPFHTLITRVFKDLLPRFKTMQGYYVPRQGGWDTHGLPVELQVEKKLGFKTKHDIEAYGIARFNEECRRSVWEYIQEWNSFTERSAFWIDLKSAYITYQSSYMESLWWIISEWWKKKLLYQDFKVLPWCTRCGTGLSSHELALGYKTVVDSSVYIRFRLASQDPKWKNVAILSWTTTPWTLPGNVALAVSADMQYVRVPDPEKKGNWVVVGRDNFPLLQKSGVFPKDAKASVAFPGTELIGLSYQPLFDVPELASNKTYKVYGADFVSAEEGTGVVHTAVMYGDDDYRLGKQIGLPTVHTITETGRFVASVKGLAGKYVKAKETELQILSHLQKIGSLFREEAYEHEYPFCWRCDTPILYYARSSWWVRVNEVRKDLIRNNETIAWTPSHVKHGRFGEWLKEEKDWAFSRERYWGTTLPLWRCDACGASTAISSVQELSDRAIPSGNTYVLMRHGESENITFKFTDTDIATSTVHLTDKGKAQVGETARRLTDEHIDLIIASDFPRTKETAEIVASVIGKPVAHDERLREINVGAFNGKSSEEFRKHFRLPENYLELRPEGGESLLDLKRRVAGFFKELEAKYRGKKILVVTHADTAWMLASVIKGYSQEQIKLSLGLGRDYLAPAGFESHQPRRLPLNIDGEIDLHRPYVDELKIRCACGGMKLRVSEVVDVWFDSGAMPFARGHYPFDDRQSVDQRKSFPADYICEGVDQTRGWFYTLLAVSTLLGKGAPYKRVISLGHLLDKNGQKMSKSKGNVVNPWEMIEKYGVDAIRWYFFTVNAPGDPKKFDEKELLGKLRGFLGTLWNSYILFNTYSAGTVTPRTKSTSLADRWILSRLSALTREVTESLEAFDIVTAARAIEVFTMEDFSNWYLRRSRRRFQRPSSRREKEEVSGVTLHVLTTLALLSAPFVPFIAESIWQGLKKRTRLEESVHCADWPKPEAGLRSQELEKKMAEARKIAATALKQRADAGIKVRQPLSELRIRSKELGRYKELLELVRDEVNVKKVVSDAKAKSAVHLDTHVTEALRREGIGREIVRNIQELRRDLGLQPKQSMIVQILAGEDMLSIVKEWQGVIKKEVNARSLMIGGKKKFKIEREIPFGSKTLWVGLR